MKKETLEQYLYSRLAKATAKIYLFDIEHYLSICPNAKKASHKEVIAYFGELHKRLTNHGTISRIICEIKQYYNYLVDTGQRNDHPCQKFSLKGSWNIRIKLFEPFTFTELLMLLQREERFQDLMLRNRVIMSLLIFQALTIGEISRLRLKDIMLDESRIRILGSSKISGRTLPMDVSQVLLFDRYLRECRKKLIQVTTDKFVLTSRGNGISTDDINYLVETYKPLFPDRNLNAKNIRASVIHNKLNIENLPLQQVQDFAGHKCAKATLQYRRPDLEKQKAVLRQFHPLSRMFGQE